MDGGVDLNQVDTDDGQKIVQNVFGPNTDQVAQTLGSNLGGGQSGLIQKLLPLLAPIVMSYLAKRLAGGASVRWWSGRRPARIHPGRLAGRRRAGRGPRSSRAAARSITDILGGLLGGGRR